MENNEKFILELEGTRKEINYNKLRVSRVHLGREKTNAWPKIPWQEVNEAI